MPAANADRCPFVEIEEIVLLCAPLPRAARAARAARGFLAKAGERFAGDALADDPALVLRARLGFVLAGDLADWLGSEAARCRLPG